MSKIIDTKAFGEVEMMMSPIPHSSGMKMMTVQLPAPPAEIVFGKAYLKAMHNKGNTPVRKMKRWNDAAGNCMEILQEMQYDGSTRKEMLRVERIMNRANKAYNNYWKHNVSREARLKVDELFRPIDSEDTPQWGMGV